MGHTVASSFLFQRRSLTQEEAVHLIRRIADEPNITGYNIREWTRSRDIFLLYDLAQRRVAATVLVHHLLGRWSEIAVVYVFPEYRSMNLATQLLQQTIYTIRFEPRSYVIYYADAKMERLLSRCGFTIFDTEQSIFRFHTPWRLYFSVLYKPQWLSNLYRIKEIYRKRRHFAKRFDFKIGILTNQQP
jgi:GNAT superfamily N-acetyltransferase